VLYSGYKIGMQTKMVPISQIDLVTGQVSGHKDGDEGEGRDKDKGVVQRIWDAVL
jgi:hypothetical protein